MRLIYVSHSFPPNGRPLANVGGMQRVATELYDALSRHPHTRIRGFVLRSSWRWNHLRVVPFMARTLVRLLKVAAAREADVVLFSSMVTAVLGILLHRPFKRAGIRMAVIAHGRDVTLPVPLYQALVPWVFQRMDLVLPISTAVEEQCRLRGATRTQLNWIPNGIDVTRFAEFRKDRRSARRAIADQLGLKTPIPEDALVLCSVGRQVPRKGYAWFAENVLPLLPRNVHYLLVGDGPEWESIQAAARRQDVSAQVWMLGVVSDELLGRVYEASDLFIMPNIPVTGDIEGFGVVMLEAGMAGLPTVGSNIEGIRDVISVRNGVLVEAGDALSFAEAVIAHYDDRVRLTDASIRARRHVAQSFAWERVAQRYVAALGGLIPNSPYALSIGDGAPVAEPMLGDKVGTETEDSVPVS